MRLQWLVPPAPFGGVLLRRSMALWLVGRIAAVVFVLLYELQYGSGNVTAADTVHLGVTTSLAFSALMAGLTVLDVHRRHEATLLANLGLSRAGLALTAWITPLLLEIVTWLVPV